MVTGTSFLLLSTCGALCGVGAGRGTLFLTGSSSSSSSKAFLDVTTGAVLAGEGGGCGRFSGCTTAPTEGAASGFGANLSSSFFCYFFPQSHIALLSVIILTKKEKKKKGLIPAQMPAFWLPESVFLPPLFSSSPSLLTPTWRISVGQRISVVVLTMLLRQGLPISK